MRRFVAATHNLTEGDITNAVADSHLIALQEIDRRKVRAGLHRQEFAKFFPLRDRHQCLAWHRDLFKRDGRGATIRLHRSGRAEGWRGIRTPARYVLRQRLVHRETGQRVTLFGVWLIPSWDPATERGEDQFTDDRERIADKSLRKLERLVQAELDRDAVVIPMGDFNSIFGRINLGLRSAFRVGLDRVFYSPGLRAIKEWEGPKTGVGDDMRHHSRHVLFEITKE
jgi:endonuclease/exonuclease/phosphatase family metal-dependent hydrolase